MPLRFWKIAAWNTDGGGTATATATATLAAVGFVVDQAPLVDTGAVREPAPGEVPPLGPFRTFQVPIADIAAATGLVMPDLIAADRMPEAITEVGWRRIEEPAEILL